MLRQLKLWWIETHLAMMVGLMWLLHKGMDDRKGFIDVVTGLCLQPLKEMQEDLEKSLETSKKVAQAFQEAGHKITHYEAQAEIPQSRIDRTWKEIEVILRSRVFRCIPKGVVVELRAEVQRLYNHKVRFIRERNLVGRL